MINATETYGVKVLNDFTKEELKLILNSFDSFEFDLKTLGIYTPLYQKIQSMLENYDKEKTLQVKLKLNLGLSNKEIDYLVDECIMPFLYPE